MELASGRAGVRVDVERGGRLASLTVDGHELLVSGVDTTDPLRWGCYPMVPWAGRVAYGRFEWRGVPYRLPVTLGPHAIHGTGYVNPWRQLAEDRIELNLTEPWPWVGRVESSFQIDEVALRWTISVTNLDQCPWPVMVGWHPWFRRVIRDRSAELVFGAGAQMERDADQIPTGRLLAPGDGPWDDCFTEVDQPIRLTWPGVVDLELRSDCSHWVVYTEPEHALCVEPQSDGPDAFNRDAHQLAPDDSPFERSFEIRWS